MTRRERKLLTQTVALGAVLTLAVVVADQMGLLEPLDQWLYDRRGKRGQSGRTLTAEDIAHYQRIVVALKETIRLMEEIDEVIEAYGGWPIG